MLFTFAVILFVLWLLGVVGRITQSGHSSMCSWSSRLCCLCLA